ncbi:14235_t:CDS:2 [Acaulospora colombiana]|uniref:14235_t:CDS:1 n=1 Tax=Acaulospora colombiana TaxID=27376 RepID=A0ACA9NVW0_9GLOM|nr:14235_t:CDS:2 [Acaulospora colombiana]
MWFSLQLFRIPGQSPGGAVSWISEALTSSLELGSTKLSERDYRGDRPCIGKPLVAQRIDLYCTTSFLGIAKPSPGQNWDNE